MGFSRQEYWNGLPFPPAGDLPNPGIKPAPPASPALAGGFFATGPPQRPMSILVVKKQETQVRDLGQEDPLEEVMATHSDILA